MPGEGERLVRRMYELLNSGDPVDQLMTEFQQLIEPDAEWVNPADAIERGTRRGLAGWSTALQNLRAGVGDAVFEIDQLIEHGDKVFVRGFLRTRGPASGAEVEGPMIGLVWTVRNGRIRRFEWFWTPEEALARFERRDEA